MRALDFFVCSAITFAELLPQRLESEVLPGLAQTVDICSEGPLEVLEKCGATDATESSGQSRSGLTDSDYVLRFHRFSCSADALIC